MKQTGKLSRLDIPTWPLCAQRAGYVSGLHEAWIMQSFSRWNAMLFCRVERMRTQLDIPEDPLKSRGVATRR